MNIEHLKETRDLIADAPDNHFGMRQFALCETAFCIGGFALIAAGYEVGENGFLDPDGETIDAFNTAQKCLGLTEKQADHLFLGKFLDKTWVDITREEALAELDRLIMEQDQ